MFYYRTFTETLHPRLPMMLEGDFSAPSLSHTASMVYATDSSSGRYCGAVLARNVL
jgi:hypothetical protein